MIDVISIKLQGELLYIQPYPGFPRHGLEYAGGEVAAPLSTEDPGWGSDGAAIWYS